MGSYHPTASSKSSKIRLWFLTLLLKILEKNCQQMKLGSSLQSSLSFVEPNLRILIPHMNQFPILTVNNANPLSSQKAGKTPIGPLNHDIHNLVQFSPVTSKRMWSRKITEKPCFMRLWKTIAKSRKSEQCYWHNWTSLLNIGQFMYAATRDLCWQCNHTKIVTFASKVFQL